MSDFSELKKLAQEANNEFPAKEEFWSMVCTPTVGLELVAEIQRLQRFETAYKEFIDKTNWVRPNPATRELGMHVADILRKRCDDLTSHCQAQAEEIKALRAASTPQHAGHIPGGAIADDVTGQRVIVSGDAINRLKASHPRACINAGLCEKIGQRLYTRVFTELTACGTRDRS